MDRISLEAVREARRVIADSAIRTPLIRLNFSDASAEIYLKLENLQPIGSFKIRGAANAIAHLQLEQLERGVVTASAGNMAQGVAWCARKLGIPCTVIAPATAPDAKVSAIERLGGRVIKVTFDEWWKAFEQRSFPGVEGTFIHSFDDPDVMAGNGTIALEILEDLSDVDAVVIPWGGGGLTCGIASVLRELRPECKVFTAEVATASPFAARRAAASTREPVLLPWLRPEAQGEVWARWISDTASEPLESSGRFAWWRRLRYVRLGIEAIQRIASDLLVEVRHPFADAGVAAALAALPPEARGRGRAGLFEDALPVELIDRCTRSHFDHVFWSEHSDELAARWNGEGVDDELVDLEALRREWQSPRPDARTFMLLQRIALGDEPADAGDLATAASA